MRAYFFVNMYLSQLQCGLQTAHCLAEMFTKYVPLFNKTNELVWQQNTILHHWATDHKTIIILNAGYSQELRSLIRFFETFENPLPWAYFSESDDALDGALTCVGIILPEEFYEGAKEWKHLGGDIGATTDPAGIFYKKLETQWEKNMAIRLNNYQLAK